MQLRVPSFSGTSSGAGAASGSTPPHVRGLRRAQEASTNEPLFKYTPAQQHIFWESEALAKYRIFPKSRRLGATYGGALSVIEYMLAGRKVLWGDTINSKIGRAHV